MDTGVKMGILDSIRKAESKSTPLHNDLTPPPQSQNASCGIATPVVEPTSPCDCGCRSFWLDAYGSIRCCDCSPPPSEALVRQRLRCELPAVDPQQELESTLAALTSSERAVYDAELAAIHLADVMLPVVPAGWRALVSTRIKCGHWDGIGRRRKCQEVDTREVIL